MKIYPYIRYKQKSKLDNNFGKKKDKEKSNQIIKFNDEIDKIFSVIRPNYS